MKRLNRKIGRLWDALVYYTVLLCTLGACVVLVLFWLKGIVK